MNKSLLPSALQDSNNLALEKCIQEAFKVDMTRFLIKPYENINEDLLPILAKEEHITGYEGWNLAKTKQDKINVISSSMEKNIKKGSIPSIKQALANIGIEAKISEFWEYAGRPAHFQIEFINLFQNGLDEELEKSIFELVKQYKPVTRILDNINFCLCNIAELYVSTYIFTTEKTTIKTKGAVI